MALVVLKYDDLCVETISAFYRVYEACKEECVVPSFGLIGSSLREASEEFLDQLKWLHREGVEIWNHGFFHTEKEFSLSSEKEQMCSIGMTQNLAREMLEINLSAFGSPHNNSNERTIGVLSEHFPEINSYLFMADAFERANASQILLRCNCEIRTGVIDYSYYEKEYLRIKNYPYFMIQFHPSFWSQKDFELHRKMLRQLKSHGNQIVTPRELNMTSLSDESYIDRYCERLKGFFKTHNNVLLYGAGEIGREIYRYLTGLKLKITAFVISDDQPIVEAMNGIPVIHASEMKTLYSDCGIVLALLGKLHKSILIQEIMKDIDIFDFESITEYEEFVDFVRFKISTER